MTYSQKLEVGGRTWGAVSPPAPEFLAARKTLLPWGVLTTGVLFTGFIAAFLLINVKRTEEAFRANESLQREMNERLQAEAALTESEERFRGAFEHAAIGMGLTSLDGRYQKVNKAWCDLIGYSEQELMTKTFQELTHPDDLAQNLSEAAKLLAGEIPFLHTEKRYLHKEGRIIWAYVSVSLVRDHGGNPLSFVTQIEDLSDRKRAEEFIKSILETVDEGFIVVDGEYRILSANRAYLNLIGRPAGDILGKHCYEVAHRVAAPCFLTGQDCAVKRVFETGQPAGASHKHLDEKGSEIDIEITSYPIKDEAGIVVSAIEVITDVTEKKKLEAQLRQAQKMEAIGQLAGGIAHDFNNMLSAISGYGYLLHMSMKEDDPQRLNVEHLLESADRAAHLTHSLLAFSRKQIINLANVDLNELIGRTGKFLRRIIGEDIDLKVTIRQERLVISADSGQLEQIFMNLATNARDAMPRGGSLAIETGEFTLDETFIREQGYGEPGAYALVSVVDTGIGMDEATRKRIFEPFFTTKEVGRGTGLGLAMVYGIVKQHHGYITVSSEPGKGTIFRLYFPLIRAEANSHGQPGATSAGAAPGGSETILLAEDDGALRQLFRTVLEAQGYTVLEATDGEDALGKYRTNEERIKLLVFDIIMPKKNGKEAFDVIRTERPGIKALFVSGYTADKIYTEGLLDKGLNLMLKPVLPGDLLRKVREMLDA